MKFYQMIFLNNLILGTLISISSYSWFSMWMGLELNLLSFIPLIIKKNNFSSEASLKYFIVQSISSIFILFSIILTNMNFEYFMIEYPMNLIFNSALLTKMGAAPFHFWFSEIMEGLNWINALILLTWQKLAPMILLMYNFYLNLYFMFIIIMCIVISGIKSWNQTSMKKILTFSSINHMGWMISMFYSNQSMWLYYFMFYFFMNFCLILLLNKFSIQNFNDMFKMMNYNKIFKLFFFINFFSLSGLPPFLGFLPKWMVLMNLMQNNLYILTFIMIFGTLLMMFTYIRITFQSLTMKSMENNFLNKNNFFFMSLLNFINIFGLLIFSLILNF
uniref:NADH-ubiquinone oxidoreductase chain 2 n=1 Tax=Cryptolaemus montrouzieri TaxID=559131 RepID=A0A109YP14_9CUCU|nr:NADH dehydrogenase subunit 2 [Cryptolaemus montrouzieri]